MEQIMGLRQSNRPVQTGSHLEKRAGSNCIVMPQKKACIRSNWNGICGCGSKTPREE